jgi:2',3'-cyclic-nucleotide 2'-phosphodiesterase / 3'-nucleotidase
MMKKQRYNLMAIFAIFLIVSACGLRDKTPKPLEIGESTTISIMTTTDLHGWVTPWDYSTDTEDPRYGLSKVATIVDSIRNIHPNTLLIDAGDWLQGNSFAEYFAKEGINAPNYPLLRIAEALKYDAMVLGNHEFNFGVDYLNKRIGQSKVPILGGNVYVHGTDTPAYTPYIMKNVGGVNVAIIGLTTPGSAVWDRPRVENRLVFGDGIQAAAKYVNEVREAGAQFVIVLAHTGLGPGSSYDVLGVAEENFGRRMLETVDGIDLFAFGHSHRVTDNLSVTGPSGREIPVIQAGRWASHLGEVKVTITRTDENTFTVETL